MLQVKCIQKFRDKTNKIYGYRLIDLDGKTQDVTSENLKKAIGDKQVEVVNLKLTSDNRLVDKVESVIKDRQILGNAPIKTSDSKDRLEEGMYKMLDKPQSDFIDIVGSGDKFCGSDFYIEDGKAVYITQLLGVYYDEKSEMYGCTLGIEGGKNGGEAYIMFQGNDAMGEEIITDSVYLTPPLISDVNSNEINNMFISFAKKVKKWISSQ